jgi:hypothetical protein
MVHKRGGAHKCDESTVRRWTCLLVQECEQQDGERASLFRSSGMWRKRQWTCIFVQMWTRRRWTCLLVQDVSNKTVNVPPCSECEQEDDERASLFRNVNNKMVNVPPCSGTWDAWFASVCHAHTEARLEAIPTARTPQVIPFFCRTLYSLWGLVTSKAQIACLPFICRTIYTLWGLVAIMFFPSVVFLCWLVRERLK